MSKILIVDDDTNISELLRLYLEKDGFDTVVANDGEKAIKAFEGYQNCEISREKLMIDGENGKKNSDLHTLIGGKAQLIRYGLNSKNEVTGGSYMKIWKKNLIF